MLRESTPSPETSLTEGLLDQARLKLRPPVLRDRAWPAVAAAAFFALSAMGFAVASVLAPPLQTTAASKTGVR
jgi:hypothetical protein